MTLLLIFNECHSAIIILSLNIENKRKWPTINRASEWKKWMNVNMNLNVLVHDKLTCKMSRFEAETESKKKNSLRKIIIRQRNKNDNNEDEVVKAQAHTSCFPNRVQRTYTLIRWHRTCVHLRCMLYIHIRKLKPRYSDYEFRVNANENNTYNRHLILFLSLALHSSAHSVALLCCTSANEFNSLSCFYVLCMWFPFVLSFARLHRCFSLCT